MVNKTKTKSKISTKLKSKTKISKKKVVLGVTAGLLGLTAAALTGKYLLNKKKRENQIKDQSKSQNQEQAKIEFEKLKHVKVIIENTKKINEKKANIKKLTDEKEKEKDKYKDKWFYPSEYHNFISKKDVYIKKEEELIKELIQKNQGLNDICNMLDKKQKEQSRYEEYCVYVQGNSSLSPLKIIPFTWRSMSIYIDINNKMFKVEKNNKKAEGKFQLSKGIMIIQNEDFINLLNSLIPEGYESLALPKDYTLELICNDSACSKGNKEMTIGGYHVKYYIIKGKCSDTKE